LASGYEKIVMTLNFMMLILNIGANLFAIPKYGFLGAAIVRFGTEVFGITLSLIFIRKYIYNIKLLPEIIKPFICGLLTGVFIYLARSLIFIPVYMLLYFILLYITRAVSRFEVDFIKGVFRR
jgi:O-antigen/teichoic acid export membrane protein